MNNKNKLVKNALYLFVTLSVTAISAGASDALPSKESTQKETNAVSNCIRHGKNRDTRKKPTPLEISRYSMNDDKQNTDRTSKVCRICVSTPQGCAYDYILCEVKSDCTCP